MASLQVLRLASSLGSTTYVVYLLLTSTDFRSTLLRLFSPTDHPMRLLALLTAVLLNLKSLPFMWHMRLFKIMIHQLYLQPNSLPEDVLFRPIVTTSFHTSLSECDYNGHKSNSTYFADLDMGRSQLLTSLLRKGILASSRKETTKKDGKAVATNGVTLADTSGQNDTPPAKGKYMIALGGVSCHFKREIKPYERYDIWTRVLSWDRKWIYLVSHMVKAGTVKPEGWDLQPWKVGNGRKTTGKDAADEETRKKFQGAIFASSIAKYVVKKGRLTIPPETVLQNSSLLPPKTVEGENGHIDRANGDSHTISSNNWTWGNVEKQRQHGLKLAESFGNLDELHGEFPVLASFPGETGSERLKIKTMGEYRDFLSW